MLILVAVLLFGSSVKGFASELLTTQQKMGWAQNLITNSLSELDLDLVPDSMTIQPVRSYAGGFWFGLGQLPLFFTTRYIQSMEFEYISFAAKSHDQSQVLKTGYIYIAVWDARVALKKMAPPITDLTNSISGRAVRIAQVFPEYLDSWGKEGPPGLHLSATR